MKEPVAARVVKPRNGVGGNLDTPWWRHLKWATEFDQYIELNRKAKRMERVVLTKPGGSYFAAPARNVKFTHSGCTLLDCALGGGWAEQRIINIVGDKSSGKTLLCIEASANFAMKYPKGKIYYREAEAAFDEDYAEALGMPIDRIDFGEPFDTVEQFFNDLSDICKKARQPVLYILDSLDALSDEAEMDRAIDKGSFGAGKAKKMSELFRRLTRTLKGSQVTLIIVSQIRDKIGVMFGDKTSRTGGRALDFYSSQVVYLSQIKTIVKTVGKIKRVTGIRVRAKLKKCKVGLPFREAEFPIKFGYGVDDEIASEDWLSVVGVKNLPRGKKELDKLVLAKWYSLEKQFLPEKRKYS